MLLASLARRSRSPLTILVTSHSPVALQNESLVTSVVHKSTTVVCTLSWVEVTIYNTGWTTACADCKNKNVQICYKNKQSVFIIKILNL